jgi:membrane protein
MDIRDPFKTRKPSLLDPLATAWVANLVANVAQFPWKTTALTLSERFREDRLSLTASSLTFTTTIALVPLITVVLAVFTAFPIFSTFQDVLQRWLIESLIPYNIAKQVLGYLTQFAGKAGQLGWAGFTVLLLTALSLVLTIDRTLNNIWRVQRPRAWTQRLLVYWTAITLGPILLGASLTITSYLVSESRGLVSVMPGGLRFLLDLLEFFMVAAALAATYHYVPNTPVKRAHSWLGGLAGAAGIELAKILLGGYLKLVPSFSAVYGAFATLPILLIWIYMVWVIVLLGAVVAAYLPSLLTGVSRPGGTPGWEFSLALEVLEQLHHSSPVSKGLNSLELAARLRVNPVQLEDVLQQLQTLDWIGRLDEDDARLVLLVKPDKTPIEPLCDAMLLAPGPRTALLSVRGLQRSSMLGELLL